MLPDSPAAVTFVTSGTRYFLRSIRSNSGEQTIDLQRSGALR